MLEYLANPRDSLAVDTVRFLVDWTSLLLLLLLLKSLKLVFFFKLKFALSNSETCDVLVVSSGKGAKIDNFVVNNFQEQSISFKSKRNRIK